MTFHDNPYKKEKKAAYMQPIILPKSVGNSSRQELPTITVLEFSIGRGGSK